MGLEFSLGGEYFTTWLENKQEIVLEEEEGWNRKYLTVARYKIITKYGKEVGIFIVLILTPFFLKLSNLNRMLAGLVYLS